MPIRCLCVDDESLAREGIKLALQPYQDFQLAGEFSSVDDAINYSPKDIDVIFVDIKMPIKDGFSLLDEWNGSLPIVVFITAFDHFAIKAFEQQAFDYILKPIDEDRFAKVVKRIEQQLSQKQLADSSIALKGLVNKLQKQVTKQAKEISVKTDEGYFRLSVDRIVYIEAVGDHVCIHLEDKQLITRQTLKHYIAELTDCGFYQIHKSYLANARQVKQAIKLRFNDYQLNMSNNQNIRLSRRYKSVLEHFIS